MKKNKMRVFISKVRENSTRGNYYFWYQPGQNGKRILLKGTFKEMTDKRLEIIEKYKSEYIKLGA
jgi:hypothetical protein